MGRGLVRGLGICHFRWEMGYGGVMRLCYDHVHGMETGCPVWVN